MRCFLSAGDHIATGDRNASEHTLQVGWVTHIEVVAGACNHGRPLSAQQHPDPCPVDTELLELIQSPAWQFPATEAHPSFMYTELPDCGGCGTGVWNRVPWCPEANAWCPQSLDPNWHRNLLAITQALRPLVDSGKVGAVALGDELVDNGVSLENVSSVARVLRQQLGPAVKLVMNAACGVFGPAGWPTIPASLDLLSCDV